LSCSSDFLHPAMIEMVRKQVHHEINFFYCTVKIMTFI